MEDNTIYNIMSKGFLSQHKNMLTGTSWLPAGSWMFWIFGALCCGWASLGANTCGVIALIPQAVGAAVVDGPVWHTVVTVGADTIPEAMCVPESDLCATAPEMLVVVTAGNGNTVLELPPLCEVQGVCIRCRGNVTVATLFKHD